MTGTLVKKIYSAVRDTIPQEGDFLKFPRTSWTYQVMGSGTHVFGKWWQRDIVVFEVQKV